MNILPFQSCQLCTGFSEKRAKFSQVNNIFVSKRSELKKTTVGFILSQKQRHECHRPAGVSTNVSRRRV